MPGALVHILKLSKSKVTSDRKHSLNFNNFASRDFITNSQINSYIQQFIYPAVLYH